MALQHLRSSTADKRATPGAMSDGQLAMNTNLVSPGLFLKDSNGDLVKVGPVHVGTTAPNATPGAGGQAGNSKGEQWLDTSSSRYVFKIWDGTAWRTEDGEFVNVSGDTMTGALGIIAGTAAAPGVFFSGDTNTGIYSPGADQVAISTNGTGRLTIDASGNVNIDSNTLYVDATNNRVGLGTSSPQQIIDAFGTIQARPVTNILGSSAWYATGSIQEISGYGVAVGINVESASQNKYALLFGTRNDGSGIQERMRISASGAVGIGTISPRQTLTLGGLTAASTATPECIDLGATYTSTSASQNHKIKLYVDSAGNSYGFTVNGSSELEYYAGRAAAPGNHVFLTGGFERARIDSSGRLLVGTSTARSQANVTATLQLENTNYDGLSLAVNNNSALVCPVLTMGKSRGSSLNSSTIVASGDRLGGIFIQGADGTDLNTLAAGIEVFVDGTPGANDMPGRLVFSTTADGASSPTERMRIDSSGRVGIGTTGPVRLLHLREDNSGRSTLIRFENKSLSGGVSTQQIAIEGIFDYNNSASTAGAGSIVFGKEDTYTSALTAIKSYIGFETINNNITTEKARIDSSGRLLVGTSSARSNFNNTTETAQVQIEGGTFDTASYSAVRYANAAGIGGGLRLGRTRGTAVNQNTLVANGDGLGYIEFSGADGTGLVRSAVIAAEVDGTTGADRMPGRLVFSTATDASPSVMTEVLRLTSNNYLRMASGTGGIQFNGDTAIANALYDYEEGTFTPTIVGTSTAGAGTYTIQNGFYTQIGNLVNFTMHLVWTAHTGTGNLQVNNLPFTSSGSSNIRFACSIYHTTLSLTAGSVLEPGLISQNVTSILINQIPTGGGTATAVPMDTAATCVITGAYRVP